MPIIHDESLSLDVQEEILDNFDAMRLGGEGNDAIERAQGHFRNLVRNAIPDVTSRGDFVVDTHLLTGSEGGKTDNSDPHVDMYNLIDRRKYILVVSSSICVGTIFFENAHQDLLDQRTEDLFERTNCMSRLVVKSEVDLQFRWTQVPIGRLVSFDVSNDLHAAPPLYEGDKKILFGFRP